MLAGIRVLDLGGRLGWLAGHILTDLGADVIKIEPPGADLDGADWRALNVSKRLLRIDADSEAGRKAILRIVARVDILIETAHPGDPAGDWLAPERLKALNPGLVHVSVTPFGRTGPRAEWRGTDLEIMAAAGAMGLAGEPDGEPLRISVPQAHSWAGAHAASGALMALLHRQAGGGGQHVDVSAQASIIIALAHAPAFADMLGVAPSRAGSRLTGRSVHGAVFRAFWRCKDGYINFVLYGGVAGRRTNEGLTSWMRDKGFDLGPLEGLDWKSFDPTGATQDEIDKIEAILVPFFESLTKFEFLEGACKREMLGYPVANVADIAADPQLVARDFWQDLALPGGGSERHCGAFYIADGTRPRLRNPALDGSGNGRRILRDFEFSDAEIEALLGESTAGAA
jgi:crotonobetainyl-CoA:carnitine CoA-transferase CaiB-like acyl-CoA transferase